MASRTPAAVLNISFNRGFAHDSYVFAAAALIAGFGVLAAPAIANAAPYKNCTEARQERGHRITVTDVPKAPARRSTRRELLPIAEYDIDHMEIVSILRILLPITSTTERILHCFGL